MDPRFRGDDDGGAGANALLLPLPSRERAGERGLLNHAPTSKGLESHLYRPAPLLSLFSSNGSISGQIWSRISGCAFAVGCTPSA
jgi:hypothetical protein